LWSLARCCDFDSDGLKQSGVQREPQSEAQQLTLVASVPVSDDEPWKPLARGRVLAVEDGVEVEER
jgi:hypothetical protein